MPVRDSEHYHANADCVVRVQDTLFRVHRFMLERDGSMFTDMVRCAQAGNENAHIAQHEDDEDPLILDDTVDEFRSLCWALYALPLEIQKQDTIEADISRLLSLAVISNKYSFTSLEKWCTNVIYLHCSTTSTLGLNYLSTCTASCLPKVLHIATYSHLPDLLTVLEERWLARLSSPDSDLSINEALDIAEQYSWRRFQGKLYYRHLLSMTSSKPENDEETLAVSLPKNLHDTHNYRLLRGFYSLSMFWDRFTAQRREGALTRGCDQGHFHTHYCVPNAHKLWNHLFAEVSLAYKGVDAQGKLNHILRTINRAPNWGSIQPACQKLLLEELNVIYVRMESGMTDHFLGPVERGDRQGDGPET